MRWYTEDDDTRLTSNNFAKHIHGRANPYAVKALYDFCTHGVEKTPTRGVQQANLPCAQMFHDHYDHAAHPGAALIYSSLNFKYEDGKYQWHPEPSASLEDSFKGYTDTFASDLCVLAAVEAAVEETTEHEDQHPTIVNLPSKSKLTPERVEQLPVINVVMQLLSDATTNKSPCGYFFGARSKAEIQKRLVEFIVTHAGNGVISLAYFGPDDDPNAVLIYKKGAQFREQTYNLSTGLTPVGVDITGPDMKKLILENHGTTNERIDELLFICRKKSSIAGIGERLLKTYIDGNVRLPFVLYATQPDLLHKNRNKKAARDETATGKVTTNFFGPHWSTIKDVRTLTGTVDLRTDKDRYEKIWTRRYSQGDEG